MAISDERLRQGYQTATRSTSRSGCRPSAQLVDIAASGLHDEGLADHMGDCRDCAEEYRALRSVAPRSASVRRFAPAAVLPSAALLLISIALGSYAYTLAKENRDLRARAVVAPAATPPVATAVIPLEKPPAPVVNVGLLELLPASALVRGDSTAPKVEVPARIEAFTMILHTDSIPSFRDYSVEISDDSGRVLWRGGHLLPSADGTFILHFDRAFIGSGGRAVTLYGLTATGQKKIESYQLAVPER